MLRIFRSATCTLSILEENRLHDLKSKLDIRYRLLIQPTLVMAVKLRKHYDYLDVYFSKDLICDEAT